MAPILYVVNPSCEEGTLLPGQRANKHSLKKLRNPGTDGEVLTTANDNENDFQYQTKFALFVIMVSGNLIVDRRGGGVAGGQSQGRGNGPT